MPQTQCQDLAHSARMRSVRPMNKTVKRSCHANIMNRRDRSTRTGVRAVCIFGHHRRRYSDMRLRHQQGIEPLYLGHCCLRIPWHHMGSLRAAGEITSMLCCLLLPIRSPYHSFCFLGLFVVFRHGCCRWCHCSRERRCARSPQHVRMLRLQVREQGVCQKVSQGYTEAQL